MKKKWLATFMLGSALMLGACGGGEKATDEEPNEGTTNPPAENATADASEEVAQQRCATCHGGNLQGMGTTPALNDVGSRLSEEEILNIIVNGQEGGMPGGLVQGEEAEALAAWLAAKK
ncbi:cytochrome c551 [Lysinibacillus sp. KU-BSD001]|uniref:cytochrome c551 n=1 Tax=Lysinibacillus sp. KU-BSD001 TaxID=3141328 RepID=UPI0036E301FA